MPHNHSLSLAISTALLCALCVAPVSADSNAEKRALLIQAKRGDAEACYELGRNLWLGFYEYGSKKKLGFDYLMKAARMGHVNAMFIVGEAHRLGKNHLPVNKETGKEWLLKAAAKGHTGASQSLLENYGISKAVAKKKKKKKKKAAVPQPRPQDVVLTIRDGLVNTRIPMIHCEEAPFEDLLTIIRNELQKNGHVVNFIPSPGDTNSAKYNYVRTKPVSLQLNDVSVADLLRMVSTQLGIEYAVTPQGVTINYTGEVPAAPPVVEDEPLPPPPPADPETEKRLFIQDALRDTKLLCFHVEHASLEDLLDLIRTELRKNGKSVNFIPLLGHADSEKYRYVMSQPVTLQLDDVSIEDILNLVGQQLGIECDVIPQGVTISYPGEIPSTPPQEEEPHPQPAPALPRQTEEPHPQPAPALPQPAPALPQQEEEPPPQPEPEEQQREIEPVRPPGSPQESTESNALEEDKSPGNWGPIAGIIICIIIFYFFGIHPKKKKRTRK